jgi:predicted nucleic acid-binding protein
VTATALDSSSLIAYLAGRDRADTRLVDAALHRGDAVLPPVVVAEMLSQPGLAPQIADLIDAVVMLELRDGYWKRAGDAGARAREGPARTARRRAHRPACIDHRVPLITHDAGFQHFAAVSALRLLP